MKTLLITGLSGFVGQHLLAAALREDWCVVGLDLQAPAIPVPCVVGSMDDPEVVEEAVRRYSPEAIAHLAAISSVPRAERDPSAAYRVNVEGTLHLLETLRRTNRAVRLLLVSTAQVYGPAEPGRAFREEDPPRPSTWYAQSKWMAEQVARFYAERHGLDIQVARPVNHIGPGQSDEFVVPALARQLAAIAAGLMPPELHVGNLQSLRDFTDVRDVVRGYLRMLERGRPSSVYNFGTGHLLRIEQVLDVLMALAGVRPRIVIDPARFRPTDSGPLLDLTRVRGELGWQPQIPLETTLNDIYREAADRVRSGEPHEPRG